VEANDLFISRARDGKLEEHEHSDLVGRGYEETGWSWGTDFFDVDNDGDDDLYVMNGTNAYNVYTRENPTTPIPRASRGTSCSRGGRGRSSGTCSSSTAEAA
jgi:hypothetical protein